MKKRVRRGQKKKKIFSKPSVAILGLLIVVLALYAFGLPFYPEIKYRLLSKYQSEEFSQRVQAADSSLSLSGNKERTGNYLIIPKIGVDIPIIDSDNSDLALSRGAWRMPETSTPDKGGNTVIAGHRFKYLPPNNLTFYLLDKLAKGDKMTIIWSGKTYNYKVAETKIVSPDEISVLDPTQETTLTLITCDPIFSEENRLVVIGEIF